ncbi:MAG: NAD(P)/FAD-dependent oxidoreductase [Acidimicrobiia bacterium]
MVDSEIPVLIIGAGPAGLAVAGRLIDRGFDFEIVEKSHQVAHSWHNHYDRLHLHTVKHLSHLPLLPFPEDYPRYVPRRRLVDYYETYARHFGIRPHFGQEVVAVVRKDDGFITSTAGGRRYRSSRVVVATGLNRKPNLPSLPGEDGFAGRVVHSRSYHDPGPFLGSRVLVVGMGNTGAEIALDLCENGVDASISVRGPVNIVPRDVLGRPTQLTGLALSRLPEWLGDRIGVGLRRLTVGDLSRFGLETPGLPPNAQLREEGKTPVIDVGTVARIRSGEIEVLREIDRLEGGEVVFVDGSRRAFDMVILATGYKPSLPDLLGDLAADLPDPPPVVGAGALEGLYFIGFDNHHPGGVLGAIFRESEEIARDLAVG